MEKLVEKKRFYNIDFLKIFMCISIFMLHSSQMVSNVVKQCPNIKEIIYHFDAGSICVEFFFIISAFFWCLNADKCNNILDFIVKKIIRMWPVICFGIIVCGILGIFKIIHFDIYANIETLLFLNGLGLSRNDFYKGLGNLHPTWFISALFWVLILFQYLYSNFSKKTVNLIMGLLVFILLTLQIRSHSGAVIGPCTKNVFLILHPGLIRALYSCAIGYFIGELYKNFNPIIENFKLNFKWNIIFSIINLSALSVIGYNIFFNPILKKHAAFLILCFIFSFILFIFNKDIISRSFNQKICGKLSVFTYSIFVTHAIPLEILKTNVFINKHLVFCENYFYLLIVLYIFLVVFFGVFTYYLIEKPMTNKLLTKYKKLKEKTEIFN
jgi:peptidoglycan/LPS O-acetylase OafA/YrhL